MVEENKKYEKNTLGWFREQAKKDGFDNIPEWKKWKNSQKWYKELSNKYDKEFADWAIQNKGKIPNKWLNAGCKTQQEYKNKCAQKAGFKDRKDRDRDRNREWRYENGRCLPKEFNKDCTSYFGEFTENLMIQTFEEPIRMPYGNPGFDWTCKRGDKIDNKSRCISYSNKSNWTGWQFSIRWNNIADWFILSAWDNRDSLTPLHVWAFHKDDIIGERKFWRRETFSISNTPEKLKEFEKYEITNRLDKLKELCNKR